MFLISITQTDGTTRREPRQALEFSEPIGPYRFRFAVHVSERDDTGLTLSHFESGMRCCEIPLDDILAHPDRTVEEHGRAPRRAMFDSRIEWSRPVPIGILVEPTADGQRFENIVCSHQDEGVAARVGILFSRNRPSLAITQDAGPALGSPNHA